MARDYRGKELDNVSEIVTLDKKDIADCDILVVKFDKPSVGTAMEIHLAWTLKKPVIVFTDVPGPLSPWLLYHATIVVASAEAALAIATALYRYHRRLCGVE
jgi:nucleoside 2-deoxyribosyltransferase